ncbi:MAG: flavin reductase family protein [Lachnospiraceae bacterium]|nr:flavin reductase family protein [Lachnospiraceae bacterium]
MGKLSWKPGNMLYPLPVVLVTVANRQGEQNIFTVAWAGTVCSDPPMVSISVRPSRHSYAMIQESGCFVINITTEKLVRAADYCGVVSGRDVDKFEKMGLTLGKADKVEASLLLESPVNLECQVESVIPLGTHDMFVAKVVAVHVEDSLLDKNNKFHLNQAYPVVYSHGSYLSLGRELGTFGYSVRKKKGRKK